MQPFDARHRQRYPARSLSRAFLALASLALALVAFAVPLAAQTANNRLTDITPWLMDRAEEIAMARSSAPHGLADEAAVWVLTANGYERAVEGTNGFACFVGRGWSGPILVGPPDARRLHPDVFDRQLRAPHCFNEAAARSILPWQIARTRALLAGVPAERVDAEMQRQLEAGRLTEPEPGAMAYMMSPRQDLGPDFGPWRPHVMVYTPHLENADWGIPGFTHDFPFVAEPGTPWAVAVLPMAVYSDGTRASPEVRGRHASEDFTVPTTNPAAFVRQAIAGTEVEVRYHRPRVKGREIFGALVPWDRVWRTGSDDATRITFGTPVTFGGEEVDAGTYEIFTIPGRDGWTVILQELRRQWGSYSYDASYDVARVKAEVQALAAPLESFTISVDEGAPGAGALHIAWDRTRATVPITVDVRSTVVPGLEEMIARSEDPPYFLAAMFYYEHGLDYERAAELMARALEGSPGHIGMLYRQALILEAAGDRAGAIEASQRSLEGALSAPRELREEYARLNGALLERLRG